MSRIIRGVIRINGEPVIPAEASIVEVEPGVYSVIVNGNSWEVRLTGDEIAVAGHRLTWEIDDPRQWKRTGRSAEGQGHVSIKAAMPGKIVRILASPGETVEAGQGIVVVEAMKMQNEIKAPRAGKVASINVKENDSVNAGAVLASIE
jgi:biotin carboxyl carrier protein